MALHPRQNSCSLFYHLVMLFGSFSISASCKFDQFKTNSARSKFGLSIVPLVSNKFGLFQIQLVSNSSCFKFGLFQIWLVSNSACFKFGSLQIKFGLFQILLVSNSANPLVNRQNTASAVHVFYGFRIARGCRCVVCQVVTCHNIF